MAMEHVYLYQVNNGGKQCDGIGRSETGLSTVNRAADFPGKKKAR